MRALVALVLLGGCFAAGSTGGSRPGVMPLLSELPADPARRDAVLDSANATAGPEQRKGMTGKERKAETAAATAAAILGGLFSKTQNVTIGGATQLDETELIAPRAARPARPPSPENADDPAKPSAPPDPAKPSAPPASDIDPSNADLIPWIKLK
jgi:hypothetical protein